MAKEKKNRISLKGLENIFGDDINELINNIDQSDVAKNNLAEEIPIDKIISNPYQPRKTFNKQELQELSLSIKNYGLIQPIIVNKTIDGHFYQLIAGERRKKAAELAGFKTIKAIIIDITDDQMMEFALIENIQRVDLNPFEEAQAYQTLIGKMKITQEALAQKVNKSRPHVTNTLRILQLPAEVLKMVNDQKLTMGHVRPLLTLSPNNELIVNLAQKAFREQWTVRAVEDRVKGLSQQRDYPKKKISDQDIYYKDLENKISCFLSGAKINVTKHKLIINYKNNKQLNEILDLLKLNDLES